jgi:small subunit ribosomal protein S15
MARMYSRKRGKSGSKKPIKKVKKSWVRYSAKEVEQLTLKIAKLEKTPSQIGLILRDNYGIPDVKIITNKSITKILKDNELGLKMPEDLTALIKKAIRLMKHLDNFKNDQTVKRGLTLTESKINRLTKYYKRKGILNNTWKYERSKAKMLVN